MLRHLAVEAGGIAVIAAVYFFGKYAVLRRRDLQEEPRKFKNDDEGYWKERLRIQEDYYAKHIGEYHKLLLWGTGGAFVVSYSALQFLAGRHDPPSAFKPQFVGYLLFGWLLLIISALIVIGYPYASSRMSKYAKMALTTMHGGDAKTARVQKQDSEAWGRLAKVLNEGTYAILVLALWNLAWFFGFNLP